MTWEGGTASLTAGCCMYSTGKFCLNHVPNRFWLLTHGLLITALWIILSSGNRGQSGVSGEGTWETVISGEFQENIPKELGFLWMQQCFYFVLFALVMWWKKQMVKKWGHLSAFFVMFRKKNLMPVWYLPSMYSQKTLCSICWLDLSLFYSS